MQCLQFFFTNTADYSLYMYIHVHTCTYNYCMELYSHSYVDLRLVKTSAFSPCWRLCKNSVICKGATINQCHASDRQYVYLDERDCSTYTVVGLLLRSISPFNRGYRLTQLTALLTRDVQLCLQLSRDNPRTVYCTTV